MSYNEITMSDVDYAAAEKARQAYYDAVNYVDEQFRQAREDWRSSDTDIREGISEINERLWHIEVKLGVREPSGYFKGYSMEELDERGQ